MASDQPAENITFNEDRHITASQGVFACEVDE
jgi:hypothetical protein